MGKKRKGQVDAANSKVNKKRKDNKNEHTIAKDVDNVDEVCKTAAQSTSNVKAVKNNNGKPKKIIFVDDEPQEVTETHLNTKKSKASKKIKEQNSDVLREEDVNDEDIDKFCDELDAEDNEQYENWVQLIEASLSSNKKKPK